MIICDGDGDTYLSKDIDIDQHRSDRNHPDIMKWCRQYTLISKANQNGWYDRIQTDSSICMFSIRKGMRTIYDDQIGVCGLTSIDRHNRGAEFSIYITPDHQKTGYGNSALTALIDHGFNDFGLNRIWGEVFEGNPALNRFILLGFSPYGVARQAYFRDGQFINATLIECLAQDWRER